MMQPRILQRDSQPEPRPPGCPRPGWVGPPEPVENPAGHLSLETNSVIPHRDGDSILVGGHRDVYGASLPMVDRVGEQIAEDTADAPGIQLSLGLAIQL